MKLFKKWKARWEGYCKCCGKCCYEKEYLPGGILITDYSKPCRFLNEDTKKCNVYVNRFNACKECRKITLWTALFSPALPPDCGYVENVRNKIRPRFKQGHWLSF
ncbi:MAG: hypothetical protein B6241_09830 [Spirochaetaceae bacterium 4572_59]|nr:MAG: hypothetical protein B6241_09830 [Spirochaetaceae bacterium 4572_59]